MGDRAQYSTRFFAPIRLRIAVGISATVLYATGCGSSDSPDAASQRPETEAAREQPRKENDSKSTASQVNDTPEAVFYRQYLDASTKFLVAATKELVAAIEADEVEEAKSLYVPARTPYEQIEPVAESLGDLDRRIDVKVDEAPAEEFGGFHRIEQALWAEETTEDLDPVAQQLLADVEELQQEARTVPLPNVQIARFANRLLDEIMLTKLTGEEERYSHVDLAGYAANLAGAEMAVKAIEGQIPEPRVNRLGPRDKIDINLEWAFLAMSEYYSPDTREYALYTELTEEGKREMARTIKVLIRDLEKVPAQIAKG
jgi:iron uptake system component EfeO